MLSASAPAANSLAEAKAIISLIVPLLAALTAIAKAVPATITALRARARSTVGSAASRVISVVGDPTIVFPRAPTYWTEPAKRRSHWKFNLLAYAAGIVLMTSFLVIFLWLDFVAVAAQFLPPLFPVITFLYIALVIGISLMRIPLVWRLFRSSAFSGSRQEATLEVRASLDVAHHLAYASLVTIGCTVQNTTTDAAGVRVIVATMGFRLPGISERTLVRVGIESVGVGTNRVSMTVLSENGNVRVMEERKHKKNVKRYVEHCLFASS